MMKKLKLLFIVLGCFYAEQTCAQPGLLWAGHASGEALELAEDIITDEEGNVYIIGRFQSVVDFDPGPGTYYMTSIAYASVFIQKLDKDRNLLWAVSMGGTDGDDVPLSIDLDSTNSLYITGLFQGVVDFNPGPGMANLFSMGSADVFLLKLTTEGEYVWAKSFGGTSFDEGRVVKVADDGIIVTGTYGETVDFDPGDGVSNLTSNGSLDIFILKLDYAGNYLWVKSFGGTGTDRPYGMTVNSTNEIVSTGRFEDMVDFDPGVGTYFMTEQGAFVSKLSNEGEFLLADQYISTDLSHTFSVTTDSEDNVLITGFFSGETDFALGAPVYNLYSDEGTSIFVTKFDTEFNFLWAKGMGSTELSNTGKVIGVDREDNVFTFGTFEGTIDLDPSAAFDYHTNIGSEGAFVQVLTPDGDFNWAQSFGADGTRTFGRGMGIDPWDNILLAGYFLGEIDVDPGDDSFLLNSSEGLGNYDVYYTKWGLPCSETFSSIIETGCESYTSPSGEVYLASGIYEDIITNYSGCDSIITIDLVINNASSSSVEIVACDSFIVPSGTTTYYETGSYNDTILNFLGCDSVITIDLTINNSSESSIDVVACESYVAPSGITTYFESGIYSDTIPNDLGCDSIITIDLTIEEPVDVSLVESGMTLTAATGYTYQWVYCDAEFAPIVGETEQSYTAIEAGDYAVVISGEFCSDTSACFELSDVGLPLHNQSETLIIPNPASNWMKIVTTNNQVYSIVITTVTGNQVRSITNHGETLSETLIDISTLSTGYYFVQIGTGDKILTKKLEVVR